MFNSVDCTRCKNGQESGINVSFGDGTMWRPERNLYFMAPLLRKETDPTQYTLDTPALCLNTTLLSLVSYSWLLKHEYNKIW